MDRFIKATLIRAIRSFCECLVSTIPAGVVITPVMVENLNWHFVYVILAWLGTALFHTFLVVIAAVATGLPEVDLAGWDDDETDEEYDTEDEEDAD